MKVVVVGGGLAGLSAAHRVIERAPEHEVVVLEAGPRAGGLLGTIERDGMVIETGPESILTDKPAAIELASRLGIADRLIATRAEHRGAYVVSHGRLEKVPEGFRLMAPARWDAWWRTPVMSFRGKLRASLEPLVPRRRGGPEESLARFVERRLGREVLDRLAQPLIGGIYGGDPDRLSLAATMPRFLAMEEKRGSVVRAMRASAETGAGARYGLFVAFDRGMQVLVDALLGRLGDRVRLHASVRSLERRGRGWTVSTERERIDADRVVLAAGAGTAARLIEPHHRRLADALLAIEHGSAAVVTFAWPREEVPHPLDAFGFVVPAVERRPSIAATFSSVKWPGRAPEGQVLLRVFLARVDGTDDELVRTARRELRELMGISAPPRLWLVSRFERAMPQYHVGHLARAGAIEAMERELESVTLAGNALRGVGIPDTIRYAESKVDRDVVAGERGATLEHVAVDWRSSKHAKTGGCASAEREPGGGAPQKN